MGRIRTIDDVDGMDVAGVFLADTLRNALAARAFDADGNAGYFASKALAMRSATGRSTAVYQTTLPSFLAASTSCRRDARGGHAAHPACAMEAMASCVDEPLGRIGDG
jgi:hypothetical protein